MTVHLLVESKPDGQVTKYVTGCGESRTSYRRDGQPEDLTVWASRVTCPACQERSRR